VKRFAQTDGNEYADYVYKAKRKLIRKPLRQAIKVVDKVQSDYLDADNDTAMRLAPTAANTAIAILKGTQVLVDRTQTDRSTTIKRLSMNVNDVADMYAQFGIEGKPKALHIQAQVLTSCEQVPTDTPTGMDTPKGDGE
jgi:hypothetical protein